MINNPVPPIETLVGKLEKIPKTIGRPAITAKKIAPTIVILSKILLT